MSTPHSTKQVTNPQRRLARDMTGKRRSPMLKTTTTANNSKEVNPSTNEFAQLNLESGDEGDVESCNDRDRRNRTPDALEDSGDEFVSISMNDAVRARAFREGIERINTLTRKANRGRACPDSDCASNSDSSISTTDLGRVYCSPPYSDTDSETLASDSDSDLSLSLSPRTSPLAVIPSPPDDSEMLLTEETPVSTTSSDNTDFMSQLAESAEEGCRWALANDTTFPIPESAAMADDLMAVVTEMELYNAAINAVGNARGPSSYSTLLRSPWWQLRMSLRTMSLGMVAPWLLGRVERERRVEQRW